MSVHGQQQSDKLDLFTHRGCGPPHVLPCSGWFWHVGVTAHMISCVTSQTRCSHRPEGLDLVGILIRSCVGCRTYTQILQTAVITTITEGFFSRVQNKWLCNYNISLQALGRTCSPAQVSMDTPSVLEPF